MTHARSRTLPTLAALYLASSCIFGGQSGDEGAHSRGGPKGPPIGKLPCDPFGSESELELEYLLATDDGRFIVVVRPRVLASYEDFRVFVGGAEEMEEQRVESVMRQQDGGTTTVEFMLDGAPAELFLPAAIVAQSEPDTLEVNGSVIVVERIEPGETLAATLDYFCLDGE